MPSDLSSKVVWAIHIGEKDFYSDFTRWGRAKLNYSNGFQVDDFLVFYLKKNTPFYVPKNKTQLSKVSMEEGKKLISVVNYTSALWRPLIDAL